MLQLTSHGIADDDKVVGLLTVYHCTVVCHDDVTTDDVSLLVIALVVLSFQCGRVYHPVCSVGASVNGIVALLNTGVHAITHTVHHAIVGTLGVEVVHCGLNGLVVGTILF